MALPSATAAATPKAPVFFLNVLNVMKKAYVLSISYVVGFAICLGSYARFRHARGLSGNEFAWLVAFLSEFARAAFGLGWEDPSRVIRISTGLAAAGVALLFPFMILLIKSQTKYRRFAGYTVGAVLLYMTVVWYQTPLPPFFHE